jgi:hypothetical protein
MSPHPPITDHAFADADPTPEIDETASDHTVGRRALLQGIGSMVVVGAASGQLTSNGPSASSVATPGNLPAVAARQSESLADAFGVVIHLNDQKSIYGNETAIVNKVLGLGARHARSQMTVTLDAVRTGFKALAAGGCQINATCQVFDLADQPTNRALMDEVINSYGGQGGGVFSSFEAVNEPNNNGIPWVDETRSRTIDLWNQAKSRPETAGIPIVGPALANLWTSQQDYLDLGDLSGHVDRGSIHMYPRGTSPSTLIDQQVGYSQASFGAKQTFCTEGGYNNALNQTTLRPVPQDVASVYAPRHLLEHYIRGNRFFRYELMDHVNPAKDVVLSNWGLVAATSDDPAGWTNKPAFRAMKNLLALVGDRGAPFTPVGLPMTITGGDVDFRSVLLQERNGVYNLCIWRDVSIYNAGQRVYTPVTPTTITVTLGTAAPVKLFKPAAQIPPIASYGLASTFDVPIAGDVWVAQIG